MPDYRVSHPGSHGTERAQRLTAVSAIERPTWIEWSLAMMTILIVVGASISIAGAIATLLFSLYAGDPVGVIAVPGMLAGGIVGLAYAAFVGIGWEVLRRLREIAGRLDDSRSLLFETRTMIADHLAMVDVGEAAASGAQTPAECDPEQADVLDAAGGAGASPAATTSHLHPSMSLLHEAASWRQVPASSDVLYHVQYRRKDGTIGRQDVRASSAEAVRRAVERRGHEVLSVGEAATRKDDGRDASAIPSWYTAAMATDPLLARIDALLAAGVTISAIAEACGLRQPHLSRWLAARRSPGRRRSIEALLLEALPRFERQPRRGSAKNSARKP